MKDWIAGTSEYIVGLFFAFSWAYYAIRINMLEHDVKKMKADHPQTSEPGDDE